MPRPKAAQFVYGSCTVILSTLAMLLLSGTGSPVGIAFIAVTGLALGLLVALTVPARRTARPAQRTGRAEQARPATRTRQAQQVAAVPHSPAPQKPVHAASGAVSDT